MAAKLKTTEKRSLLVRDIQDGTKDTTEQEISLLERQIATAMTSIAYKLEQKYMEYIPDLVTSNQVLETIRSACEAANRSIDSVADSITNLEKDVELNKNVLQRLESVKNWKSKMGMLEQMESLICRLWYSPNEENALLNARLITDLEAELKNISQEDESVDKAFVERIGPALKRELISLRQGLTYMLNMFWDQTFSLRELNDKVILQLPASSSDTLNERLAAMDLLNLIDGKVSKFASALMHHFCQKIIMAKDPAEVISYRGATAFVKHEYVVRKEKPENGSRRRPDPEKVFRAMLELFKNLGRDLGEVTVNGKSIVQLIGDKISNSLVETLVHECLTPAVPYESKDMPAFEKLLALSDEFGQELKRLGFFSDSTQSFQKFAENYECTFISRRCSKIVAESSALIKAPLTEFITVGNASAANVENVEEFYKLGLLNMEENHEREENYPKLLQLSRCEISKTAIGIADLIVRTLDDAGAAESATAMAELLQTSRNIVELFIQTSPRVHDSEISSVPLLAAVFYNNCYYLCHRLMTLTAEVLPKMQSALQSKNLCITFTDFIPNLRQLAAESMEKQLTQCRRQLSTLLADNKIFIGLDDVSQYEKCTKCLDGGMMQLEQISGIWKGVLTETVYANCMGNIVSFFFNSLIKMILSAEDIRANDAELSATLLKKILKKSEMLFVTDLPMHSSIHKYAEAPYYRMKELVFCLDSSLQNIYDRWCDGKGPLAQWLRANEVRRLLKALFQNTERRAFVLSKIN